MGKKYISEYREESRRLEALEKGNVTNLLERWIFWRVIGFA